MTKQDPKPATPIPDTSAGEREMVQQSIATKQSTDATDNSASETAGWQLMETAPRDRQIIARRHNDVSYEYYIVWWTDDAKYPWQAEHTSYPTDRLDEWHAVPGDDTPENVCLDREKIARIIDPAVFNPRYVEFYPDNSTIERFAAFQKADEIISFARVAETRRTAPDDTSLVSGVSADPPSSAGERMREALEALWYWAQHNGADVTEWADVQAALALDLQGPSGKTPGAVDE